MRQSNAFDLIIGAWRHVTCLFGKIEAAATFVCSVETRSE